MNNIIVNNNLVSFHLTDFELLLNLGRDLFILFLMFYILKLI